MKYQFKTQPFSHQREAIKHLLKHPYGALFLDPGTGKSKVVIDTAAALSLREPQRVLVLCPLSVIDVWHREIAKHQPEGAHVDWRITNYEKTLRHFTVEALHKFDPTFVVCDESHRIKTASAKRTKAACKLGVQAPRRAILTGTPTPRNPLDLFGQFKFLDPSVFGTRFADFRAEYAMMGGYGGYEIRGFKHLDDLQMKIAPYVYRARKEDCLDLPEFTHVSLPVDLGPSRATYDQMAKEAIAEIEGEDVLAPVILTRLLRLSQITGGWINASDNSKPDYRRVGEEKLLRCRELLSDLQAQGRKVVVFCRFRKELQDVVDLCESLHYSCRYMHGNTSEANRAVRIKSFTERDEPIVFACQTGTGALGIDLSAASEAIFYSHSYDGGEFQQACDRLHRQGQINRVTYYHLIARKSIDLVVMRALKAKRSLQEELLCNVAALGAS